MNAVVINSSGGSDVSVSWAILENSRTNLQGLLLLRGDAGYDEARKIHMGWPAAEPFSSCGFFVNYEADVTADRMSAASGFAKFDHPVALNARYDPDNLFRLNQNIPLPISRR